MNFSRILRGVSGATLLCFGLVAAKHRFYDPSHRLSDATEQVSDLAGKGLLQEGDIIFQTSRSSQSQAIRLATHSPYSHCGLICKGRDGMFMVYEAVQPVKFTRLGTWIARGTDGHYVIKRLRNVGLVLNPAVLQKMRETGKRFLGKDYDIYFGWSDERIYCSELVWKIYKESTGLEIGKTGHLKDFDLSSEAVQRIMKKRYGNTIPLEETVISPASMFNSELLRTVREN